MTDSLDTLTIEELRIATKVLLILPTIITDCDAKKYKEIAKMHTLVRDLWIAELNKNKSVA